MNTQSIIVPKLSTVPVHEARARAILRWLVREKVVEEQLTTCGRTGNRMGHALAAGRAKWPCTRKNCPSANRSTAWK